MVWYEKQTHLNTGLLLHTRGGWAISKPAERPQASVVNNSIACKFSEQGLPCTGLQRTVSGISSEALGAGRIAQKAVSAIKEDQQSLHEVHRV